MPQKWKLLPLRFVVAAILLSGLFFSNAEGVRLLPFPEKAETGWVESISTYDAPTTYLLSARSSASQSVKNIGKFKQRSEIDHSLIVPNIPFAHTTQNRVGSAIDLSLDTFTSTAFLSRRLGRAPPIL